MQPCPGERSSGRAAPLKGEKRMSVFLNALLTVLVFAALIGFAYAMSAIANRFMNKNAAIGYEAANHYYFSKGQLLEKIVNCHYVIEKFEEKAKEL